jgi:hypothetical protein
MTHLTAVLLRCHWLPVGRLGRLGRPAHPCHSVHCCRLVDGPDQVLRVQLLTSGATELGRPPGGAGAKVTRLGQAQRPDYLEILSELR